MLAERDYPTLSRPKLEPGADQQKLQKLRGEVCHRMRTKKDSTKVANVATKKLENFAMKIYQQQ